MLRMGRGGLDGDMEGGLGPTRGEGVGWVSRLKKNLSRLVSIIMYTCSCSSLLDSDPY